MSNKDNRGPAFPSKGVRLSASSDSPHVSVKEFSSEGMTLRDYIAIRASEEDYKRHQVFVDRAVPTATGWVEVKRVVDVEASKYRYADAMLEARKQ